MHKTNKGKTEGESKKPDKLPSLAYNLTQTGMVLNLSRPTVSRLVAENAIRHRRVGRRVLISHEAIVEFLNGYDAERGEY